MEQEEGSSTQRNLKILLSVGVVLIVASGTIVVILFLPSPEGSALTDKPAIELVIAFSDMEAGWTLYSQRELTIASAGFRTGYERSIRNLTMALSTTAWTFDSVENASRFYDESVQEVQGTHSTESRAFGDVAIYWEDGVYYKMMLIRKSNVVWGVVLFRFGAAFPWTEGFIDRVAGTLTTKF